MSGQAAITRFSSDCVCFLSLNSTLTVHLSLNFSFSFKKAFRQLLKWTWASSLVICSVYTMTWIHLSYDDCFSFLNSILLDVNGIYLIFILIYLGLYIIYYNVIVVLQIKVMWSKQNGSDNRKSLKVSVNLTYLWHDKVLSGCEILCDVTPQKCNAFINS